MDALMRPRPSRTAAQILLAGLLTALGRMASDSGAQEPLRTPAVPQPSSSATVGLTNSMSALNDKAKLGAGDRLSFRVVEERREPIPLLVTDTGEVEIPYIGRVPAQGLTCKELAHAVKPLLEKEYFKRATVIIGLDMLSTRSRGKVYLMGQVKAQGALDIPADETLTVSKVILRAGGLADFANRKKVRLIHRTADNRTETTVVDLTLVLDKGQIEKDPVVEPDDLIIVPERLINF